MITCCHKHKCRLLEACWHCGELIPLFTSPFTVGNCPRCRQSLKLYTAASVSDDAELEISKNAHNDIVFLLTPQSWESESSSIIKRVGRWLSHMRQMKQCTAVEVAGRIGVTLTILQGIERGDFQGRGATLLCYFKYANYLSLALEDVFCGARNAPEHVPATTLPLCPTCRQNSNITRCGHNRSGSQRYQCHCCHRSFTPLPKAHQLKRILP
jgi:hypothetical protein